MKPLMSAPPLSIEEVRYHRRELLPYIDSSATHLSQDDLDTARERLYLLIGSVARAYRAKTKRPFPARDTLGLAQLFDYSSRLGLVGGSLVARALAPATKEPPPPIGATGKLALSFAAPAFTLRSERGWTIRFPYYFMIGTAETSTMHFVDTDVVLLSTLLAPHWGMPGGSQATLLFVATSSASADRSDRFLQFWLEQFGIEKKDELADTLVGDSRHYRRFDADAKMHKEVVTLRRGPVVMFVQYSGLPGTFEANREDFLDVLRGLRFTAVAK